MKLRKLLTLVSVIATSLFLGSCEDEKPFEQAKIGVNPTSVSMTAEAGEATIKLKSNRDWKSEIITNSEDKSWIVIDKTSGAAAEDSIEIKISVTPNTAEDRQATIVFKTETVKAEVRVSQVGAKPKEYAKISDIRALYKDTNVKIEGEKTIKASVISNNTVLNNATSRKTLVVSDGEAGISIYLTADNKELVLGDELEISVGGLELQRYQNGSLQINALPLENITKLGTKVIPAKQITAAELLTGNYESMYVTIPEVQVVKEDLEKTFATSDKHSSINMEAKTGEKFVIFSSRYSTFKDEKVPQGSGSLSGIAAVFGGTTFQISVTSADDYKGLTGERFANEAPVTPGIIGDYAKWNALGAATGFADNFVAVSSGYQKYEQDAWMFYTNDGSDIKTGWKTGVYNEDKYLDIAPYSTSLDKVTAFALFQRINVKDATDKKLNFKLAYYYQDAADASKLEVVASENFTGDFEKATWTVVKDASFAEGADKNKWVSHSIDLTEQFGTKTNVAIAFRYTGKSNTYRLDDVQFGGKAFPDAPEVEYDGDRKSTR